MKTEFASVAERSLDHSAGSSDPAFTPFVTASGDEIRYAQRLREQLERRYLNRPSPRATYWSVGAD